MWYTHSGLLFILKKERSPAICNNIGETGEHYAKWHKPDKERQIPGGFTYMWNLEKKKKKKSKTQKQRVESWLPVAGAGGNRRG